MNKHLIYHLRRAYGVNIPDLSLKTGVSKQSILDVEIFLMAPPHELITYFSEVSGVPKKYIMILCCEPQDFSKSIYARAARKQVLKLLIYYLRFTEWMCSQDPNYKPLQEKEL